MSPERVATPAERAAAVADALKESGQLPDGALDAVEQIEEKLDWHNGARVVARAWSDPEYKARLLADGTTACAELGFEGPETFGRNAVRDPAREACRCLTDLIDGPGVAGESVARRETLRGSGSHRSRGCDPEASARMRAP